MRRSVSESRLDAAPCFVSLPTSSLSNAQKTGTLPEAFAARKPSSRPNTQPRSSSRGARMNAFFAPKHVPRVRTYRLRSSPSTSSSCTPAALATTLRKLPEASCIP